MLKPIFALVFVVLLILIIAKIFQYFFQKYKPLDLKSKKISLLERHYLDSNNQVIILKVENKQYTILVGKNSSCVLDTISDR